MTGVRSTKTKRKRSFTLNSEITWKSSSATKKRLVSLKIYFMVHIITLFEVQVLKEYRDDVLLREYLKRFDCFSRAVKTIKHIFAYMVRQQNYSCCLLLLV